MVRLSAWHIDNGHFVDPSETAALRVTITAMLEMPDAWNLFGRRTPTTLFGKWCFLIWPSRALRFWEDWDPLDTIALVCLSEDIAPVRWRDRDEAV